MNVRTIFWISLGFLLLPLGGCSPSLVWDMVVGGVDPIVWWILGAILGAAAFLALRAAGFSFMASLGIIATAGAALAAGIVKTRGRREGRLAERADREKVEKKHEKVRDDIRKKTERDGGDAARKFLRDRGRR